MGQLSGLGEMLWPKHWAELLTLGGPLDYAQDAVMMRSGEEGHVVLVLREGRVKIYRMRSDGNDLPLAVRYPGEILGDVAALNDIPHTATVVAIDHCVAQVVPVPAFRRFVTTNALYPQIQRHFTIRHEESEQRRAELITYPVPQRLCRLLVRLTSKDTDGRDVVDVNMTQEELGRMIGASRNATGIVFGELRRLGIVRTSRCVVTVNDLATLRELAEHGFPGRGEGTGTS